ncbi:MAG: hypothetical protein KKD36_04525 [Bacteroidetes bacterium]|nr:hypothetical protein [Bacteroidota bacterium]
MNRILQYFKLLLLSWFAKGKSLWKKIWISLYPEKEFLDPHEESNNINSQKYHSIFNSTTSTSELLVSENVWNKIQSSLSPQRYRIPNPSSLNIIKTMSSDTFNHLFQKDYHSPHLFVDPFVWNQITKFLPQSYVLPNPVFDNLSKPMTGKYYENLFPSTNESNNKTFVDHTVWEPIKKNLPNNYSLPIPLTKLPFNEHIDMSYYPLNSKPIETDAQIKETILNSLPEKYRIPNIEHSKLFNDKYES